MMARSAALTGTGAPTTSGRSRTITARASVRGPSLASRSAGSRFGSGMAPWLFRVLSLSVREMDVSVCSFLRHWSSLVPTVWSSSPPPRALLLFFRLLLRDGHPSRARALPRPGPRAGPLVERRRRRPRGRWRPPTVSVGGRRRRPCRRRSAAPPPRARRRRRAPENLLRPHARRRHPADDRPRPMARLPRRPAAPPAQEEAEIGEE